MNHYTVLTKLWFFLGKSKIFTPSIWSERERDVKTRLGSNTADAILGKVAHSAMADIIIRSLHFDVNDWDSSHFYQCKYFKNKYSMTRLRELIFFVRLSISVKGTTGEAILLSKSTCRVYINNVSVRSIACFYWKHPLGVHSCSKSKRTGSGLFWIDTVSYFIKKY